MAKKINSFFNTALATAVAVSGVAALAPTTEASTLSFPDVNEGDFFYDAVMDLANRDVPVIKGYADGKFGPYNQVTRGQAAVMLSNALGLDTENVTDPEFKDIPTTHDYYGAIAALANAGHISGYADNTFKPSEPISRYHMALILASAYDLVANDIDELPFTDIKIADYKDEIAALFENKVTVGTTPTTFSGDNKVTRGQMAVFIVAAEKAANPTVTISEVTESAVKTNNGQYTFSTEVAAIFAESNHAALQDAEMKVKVEKGEIVEVQSITLNAEGTEETPVVFDGGDSTINGDLTVNGDFVEVKNLTVTGDVKLTGNVVNTFTAEGLVIDGELVIEEVEETETLEETEETGEQAETPEESEEVAAVQANLFASVATTETTGDTTSEETGPKVSLKDSTVKAVKVNRNNVELTSNKKVQEVKVASNVAAIQLKTSVKDFVVANKETSVTLGESVAIEKMVVPTGSDITTIVNNYNDVRSNIGSVVEEEGEVLDTTIAEVSDLETLKAALADTDITTINLTADIENVEERIVVDRAVTINGGEHTISFTEAINTLPYGSRHGILVSANDVTINDLTVQLTDAENWQGAYALQVYNAKDVVVNNFTGTGADAALLVNAADVELTGTTTVAGNEYGGIEVSKGTAEGLSNSNLLVNGTIANADETAGEPTIWLAHNKDTDKTAQGTVSGDALADATINYLNKEDGTYQTQYFFQGAPVVLENFKGSIDEETQNVILEIDAESFDNLAKLEVDHNVTTLPEFSVYPNAENPYGSAEAKAQFEELGVEVTYSAEEKKWNIDFGATVSAKLAEQTEVKFYIVVADEYGYDFGSMYNTNENNTLTIKF